jgi:hypothetical protein
MGACCEGVRVLATPLRVDVLKKDRAGRRQDNDGKTISCCVPIYPCPSAGGSSGKQFAKKIQTIYAWIKRRQLESDFGDGAVRSLLLPPKNVTACGSVSVFFFFVLEGPLRSVALALKFPSACSSPYIYVSPLPQTVKPKGMFGFKGLIPPGIHAAAGGEIAEVQGAFTGIRSAACSLRTFYCM